MRRGNFILSIMVGGAFNRRAATLISLTNLYKIGIKCQIIEINPSILT